MVVLGSDEIKKLIKIKKLLENIEEENIQPSSVDLRVKCIYKPKGSGFLLVQKRQTPEVEKICEGEGNKYTLKPNEYVIIETFEKVNLSENLMAFVRPRSTLWRCGVSLLTSLVDPGYKGEMVFGMKNFGEFPFEIEIGSKIAQIVFQEVKGNKKLYDGKYQGGKVN